MYRMLLMALAILATATICRAAIDNAMCSTADAGAVCSGAETISSANEELGSLRDGTVRGLSSVSGTVNAITATTAPAITSYTDNTLYMIKPAGANTGAVTLNIQSIGAKSVVTMDGAALTGGELQASAIYILRYYAGGDHFRILNGAASPQTAYSTKVTGASGSAGSYRTTQVLTADATAVTSTSLTSVMAVTTPASGTYAFRYLIRYRSAATTTGVAFAVNYTGTSSSFVSHWYHVTDGTTAATGIADGVAATAAGQLVEGKTSRTLNSSSSATVGVDTAGADLLAVMEGVLIATGSGNLQLVVGSEVSGSGITVKAGTSLLLEKMD